MAFPADLLSWAGHRDGGVKKPFARGSGRPSGQLIETGLTSRLRDWAEELAAHNTSVVPTAMFLVGGPGNGKTDAIETAIGLLDQALGAKGALVSDCEAKFSGSLPPRKAIVDLRRVASKRFPAMPGELVIIQDATEVDVDESEKTPEQLLLDDLEDLVGADDSRRPLFLCGVNRGILAHAALLGQAENRSADCLKFLDTLTLAATSGPRETSCWPLEGYSWAVGWPMDVESLMAPPRQGTGAAPVSGIFAAALEGNRWDRECAAGDLCPFHANRERLSGGKSLENLTRILHFFELASGKRWSFRDLFSLVAHSLVGHEAQFVVDRKRVEPCEWAAFHAKRASRDDEGSLESAWLLASRLYQHALFQRWPTLDDVLSDVQRLESQKVKRSGQIGHFLRSISDRRASEASSIGRTLDGAFCELLDPANTVRELRLSADLTVGALEDAFSISVERGLELVRPGLSQIETLLLEKLAALDVILGSDDPPPSSHPYAERVRRNLRAFASRLAKRSLGVSAGVCRDFEDLDAYDNVARASAAGSSEASWRLRRAFLGLLHGQHDGLVVPLGTTFGQPPLSTAGSAYMIGDKVKVHPIDRKSPESRPVEQLPYLEAHGIQIPVTFQLFKALTELGDGLMAASLSGEIYALVDGVRNRLAGWAVHDPNWLEDARVEIGGSRQELIVQDGKIVRNP